MFSEKFDQSRLGYEEDIYLIGWPVRVVVQQNF